MKQYRIILFAVFVMVFLAAVEARAQAIVDGQPSVLKEDKGQSNYVYDLKLLIKKSKDNIKTVNEKIKEQAVIKRNQQREQKAREYYQQALKLQEEGRLEEARQLFDKAITITEHPEMKYYIKESERRSKLQEAALERQETDEERRLNEDQKLLSERAEASYIEAVTLYKQQKFREAKDEFLLVEEMLPDYKAVRSYLQIIEQDIIQSEGLNLKEQRKEIERQQNEEEIARLREKELWRKEIDRKEEERRQQLRKQAQGVYDQALKLYNERNYVAAREKFQEVDWVVPDYKATRAYLTRIENDLLDEKRKISLQRQNELEKQRWQETLDEKKSAEERRKAMELREQQKLFGVKDQAEFVYAAAVALFDKDLLPEAMVKFDEVDRLYPDYRSTRDYLKRIEQITLERANTEQLKKKADEERRLWEEELVRRKEEKETFKRVAAEADEAYEDALRLYQTGRLIEAKEKFLAVDERIPDYKASRRYLKRIDDDISLLVKTQRTQDALASQRQELEKLRSMRDKAEIVYTEALVAYEGRHFIKAKEKFQEVDDLFPDYKKTKAYLSHIDDDIRAHEEEKTRAVREKNAETLYAQAMALYQAGQFEEAKIKFVAVQALVPAYKQTNSYLDRVDEDILKKKESDLAKMKEERVKLLYGQAMALFQNGELADAKEKFLEVEIVYPGYKDTSRILETIDAGIEKQAKDVLARQQQEVAEQAYAQALGLYQAADYAAAKQKFIIAEVTVSGYKDTAKYLARIDGDIERKKKEDDLRIKTESVEPIYAQAISLYREFDFVGAKNKFIQVQVIFPYYKETTAYLARIEKDMYLQEKRLAKTEKMRAAESLYVQAMKFYGERDFVGAKEKFVELAGIDPEYKNVRSYLSRINNDIREESSRRKQAQIEERVGGIYARAVTLYHDRDFEEAKEKFLDVANFAPEYKKTKSYLSRIDADIQGKKKAQEKARQEKAETLYKEAMALMSVDKLPEAFNKFSEVVLIYPDYKAAQSNLEKLRVLGIDRGFRLQEVVVPPAADPKAVTDEKVAELYKEAVRAYKKKKYDDARVKFLKVAELSPGFRSVGQYLDSFEGLGKARKETGPVVAVNKAEPVSQKSIEVDVRGSSEPVLVEKEPMPVDVNKLAALSTRSNDIYQQIKSLSVDKDASRAASTFAKVDRLISDLETQQRRIAEQIARQKKREAAEAARLKAMEQEDARSQRRLAAEQAQQLKAKADDREGEEARAREVRAAQEQAEVRKRQRAELERIKDQQHEAQIKAEVFYQKAMEAFRKKDYQTARDQFVEAGKVLPEYKDSSKWVMRIERAEDEGAVVVEENKSREQIKELAEKAAQINVEVLALSKKRDYEAVEKRFNDLEAILKDIQGVKAKMLERRNALEARWEARTSAHDAVVRKNASIKGAKAENVLEARQQAIALFRQGQQSYNAGSWQVARVKFMDAARLDPSYKAPMSYVARIDRLLSKKDFEAKQSVEKAKTAALLEGRSIENKTEEPPMPDVLRAAKVSGEGIQLYKAKHYREARIKFEELLQVGVDADKLRARRYLGLIDEADEKEKKALEAAKRKQEERYLEEHRARAKLEKERDARLRERELRKTRELLAAERELGIERQRQLRLIEQQNLKQRQEMLLKKNAVEAAVLRSDLHEQGKFLGEAKISAKTIDIKIAEQKEMQQQLMAERVDGDSPELSDTVTEAASSAMIRVGSGKAQAGIQRGSARDKDKEIQRRRAQEAGRRRQMQAEKQERAQQVKRVREQRAKDAAEEALIRRNQQEVEAILKNAAVSESSAGLLAVAAPAAGEDPSTRILKQAAIEEKGRLDQQRMAIRKDFEAGVEGLYNEGVLLYKKRAYEQARQDLLQVDALIKGYKKTAQYLKNIDRVMLKQAGTKPVPAVPASTNVPPERMRAVADTLDSFDIQSQK